MATQLPDDETHDPYGPSDSSDSASERPPEPPGSDSAGTGERPSVEPPQAEDDAGRDIDTDHEQSADQAGLSRSAPDPRRNGGLPPASGRSPGGEDQD